MGILPSEVQFYLSAPNAAGGFTQLGVPGSSLGRYMSSNQVNGQLDDIFLDITSSQNAALQVDYQCVFIMNNTSSGDLAGQPYAWIPVQTASTGGATFQIALDFTGASQYNTTNQQALVIANSLTPPQDLLGRGLTWQPAMVSQYSQGIALPALEPQQCVAIWLQRTATASLPMLQSFQLVVTFTSPEP